MSDGTAVSVGDIHRVLVVGDSSRIETTMSTLHAAFDPASVVRERTVSAALERLTDADVDVHCIVCEFDPAAGSGDDRPHLARLADRTDVPIVAVIDGGAADGSTAERALEAGATDVVGPDDARALVASRVRNVAQRRRPAADAELERDRRSRALLESSDALVFVLDETGAVTYASPAVESRLGYTSSELERTTLERIVHPDDRGDARETVAAVASAPFGSSDQATIRLSDADGAWRRVDLTCVNRVTDPSIDGIVATVIRIDPLESAAVSAPSALERLTEPFFTLDSDWRLRYANSAATRLFDGEPEPGSLVWERFPGHVRETVADRLREASAIGSVVSFDVALDDRRFEMTAYPDETGLSVLARPVRPGIAAVGRDGALGERAGDEDDRLALLESTIDALEDGVAVLEGSTIRLANATLFELTGATTLVDRDVDALFDDALAATVRERARSPVVRWMEPIRGDLEIEGESEGGETVPVDVIVTPLPDDDRDRTLCTVRDRRRSAAASLTALCRTIAALRDADSRPTVHRAVVDGIRACADAELAAWYLLDEDALRPAAAATADGDGQPSVELPPIDRRGLGVEDALEIDAATVYDRSTLEPLLARAGIRAERVLAVPVGDHGVVLATSSEPMAFEALDLEPTTALAGAALVALDRLASRSQVRDCRRNRARLAALVTRSDRVRDVERGLLTASTRDAVERRLCEGVHSLTVDDGGSDETGDDPAAERDADAIELAWVGRVATGSETVSAGAWVGRDGDVLESVSIPVDPTADDPTGRTAARRDATVVADLGSVASADRDATGLRHRLRERGFRSALCVPIEHGEFQYGVLTAYATRPAAFDDRLRSTVEHLARVAGYAIGALERKRALLADTVAELEVVVRDESEPLSAIARRVDARIDVRSVVPRSSGGSTVYCTIGEADGETIRSAVEAIDAVDSIRFVGDGADERGDGTDSDSRGDRDRETPSPIELRLSDSSVTETLAEYGGVLRSITPAEGRARLVIDLSSTVDVRSFVQTIDRAHPGTELVARRERDRSVPAARAFDIELRERLSDRQLRTLEAAYYGGFFDWPRESTGEDVAESIGVSQPTFSRHLRKAQRKLFELLFDERSGNG